MAMLEIQDIHKSFYTYDDKPRFHLGPFPRGSARRVASLSLIHISEPTRH